MFKGGTSVRASPSGWFWRYRWSVSLALSFFFSHILYIKIFWPKKNPNWEQRYKAKWNNKDKSLTFFFLKINNDEILGCMIHAKLNMIATRISGNWKRLLLIYFKRIWLFTPLLIPSLCISSIIHIEMFISGEWLFENQIMNLKILFNVKTIFFPFY